MAKHPAFFASQTLLGGKPDRNRRTIYAYDTDSVVMVFNAGMQRWTNEMEFELRYQLSLLNAMAEDLTALARSRRRSR